MKNFHSKLEWRDVTGFEGDYEVSTTGLVRTKEGRVTQSSRKGTAYSKKWKQRPANGRVGANGYVVHRFKKDGKQTWKKAHRMVAEAFLPTIDGKEHVNHIDGNKLNNNVENLEWCTAAENNKHAIEEGLRPRMREVALFHRDTQATFYFNNMAEASRFVGKTKSYLAMRERRGMPYSNEEWVIDVGK